MTLKASKGSEQPYLCAVTVHEFSAHFRSELNSVYPVNEVDAMWKWFLAERLPEQVDPIRRNPSALVDDRVLTRMKDDLERLMNGEPFQYVMGHAFFFGMRLSVDKRVLIPRPETEEMLGLITDQEKFRPEIIVDLCTGSGCIALGLKKSFVKSEVTAIDVDSGAVELAGQNSKNLDLDVRCVVRDILASGWTEGLPQATHLVVSNPPYILPSEACLMHSSVVEHEPSIALFVPQEDPLLFYRPIAAYARETLVHGGQLWFEINPLKSEQICGLLQQLGFESVTLWNDLSGKARFAMAVR